MPINNIVFTNPTVILWFDTCKYGIGEYNEKGMAWCWYIPPKWHGVLTLNLLELLDSSVSIYMTIQQLGHRDYITAFTNGSISFGCTHKAFVDPVNEGGHD